MSKSIKVPPKKRGRPATGRDPFLTARVPPDAIKAIETWARSNDISRSEAVRRLLEAGLAALVKPKAKSK
jgi:hypothetical protein